MRTHGTSALAAPCEDAAAIADESMFTDPTGYVGTVPPAGTYRAEITTEELLGLGASEDFALRNAATVTWVFGDDGSYTFEGVDGVCPGVLEIRDGIVWTTEEPGHPCGVGGGFRWREVPGGILMAMPYFEGLSVRDVVDLRAFFERTWTLIDGEAPAVSEQATAEVVMPPDGVYRMELTLEEALAAGAMLEWAIHDLAGTNTLEIRGDQGIWRLRPSQQGSRGSRDDGFTIRVEGDHVIFDGTGTGYRSIDTLTWRLEGDQLIIDVIAVTPQSDAAFDRILLETKPWTRVGDV